MSSKVLIITGMHRSGTSLTSHYLSECGLHIGDNLINYDISNPLGDYKGHHEDKDFLDFHKQVLQNKGINTFPANEFRLPVRVGNRDRERALELLKSRAEISQWGWKDPRTTLFLNFWHEIIENARYLFLFRHPLAVVDSLLRRGQDSQISRKPIIALKAWQVYNQQILAFWEKHQDVSVVFEIDELIKAPEYFRFYLEKKIGLELKPIPFEKILLKKSLNSQYSDQVNFLAKQHSKTVFAAIKKYQELQNIAQSIQRVKL